MHHRAIDTSLTVQTAPGSPGLSPRTGHRYNDAREVCTGARTSIAATLFSTHRRSSDM